jgi:hypothetical protein
MHDKSRHTAVGKILRLLGIYILSDYAETAYAAMIMFLLDYVEGRLLCTLVKAFCTLPGISRKEHQSGSTQLQHTRDDCSR